VYAWLPAEQASLDADTILAVHTALSRTVPFHGVGLGPISLADRLPPGGLPPGVNRWDPRAPRWVREGQDGARLSAEGRFALRVVESVTQYQPAVKVLDVVDLARLRRPSDMATDAVDYVALRWDGRPEEAIRQLRELGWLEGDHWGRLVYFSTRGEPAEWRRVQRTGLPNSVYCPDRLLDRPAELAAMSEVAGGASFPFRP
jgi:hypothetical protein